MIDARLQKMAQVLVKHSLSLQPNEQLAIYATTLAEPLTLAVYEEALKAGANVFILNRLPGEDELFYALASEAQLQYASPVRQLIADQFDALLRIDAPANTRALSGIAPERVTLAAKASAQERRARMERAAQDVFKPCLTVYPTPALAQEAEMSLRDYAEFVFDACFLNAPDPIAEWEAEGQKQLTLIRWLMGKDHVTFKGADIDLTLSIKDRRFKESDGKRNFPSGEIFTGPVEESVNGWVRYRYPAIYQGQEVSGIELHFENGKVVKEQAAKGQALLTNILNTDAGARYLGEWGIGTNYHIQRFTKDILFDEKIGGTVHFAVGAGYPDTGSHNTSAIHWDMICDMSDSEIRVDGELFYKNGKPAI